MVRAVSSTDGNGVRMIMRLLIQIHFTVRLVFSGLLSCARITRTEFSLDTRRMHLVERVP
jgi:hypothetical protein